jgi:hypothetical protein
MTSKEVLCVVASLALCGCMPPGEQRAADAARATDEVSVQAAAIDSVAAYTHAKVVLVVNTRAVWIGDSLSDGMRSATWADFVRRASVGGMVGGLGMHAPFQGVGSDWRIGGAVTDTVVIAVSSVGFSPSRDEAIIYVDRSCGTRCGLSEIMTFHRRETAWVLTDKVLKSRR